MPGQQQFAPAEPAQSAARTKKVIGTVYFDTARCKGCGFCIEFCPPHVLEFSDGFNAHGYHFPRLVHPDGCTGCDLCGLYCPDFAIYGVMRKYQPPKAPDPPPCATPGSNGVQAGASE